MVLWELALGTAYFLGLRRTYRLALKTQRRIVGPNHPKIRGFLHRRTQQIFNVALRVHTNIQQRDIEIGRNLGNWILRRLDRMKPSAKILLSKHTEPSLDKAKRLLNSTRLKQHANTQTSQNRDVGRLLFLSLRNLRPKSFPSGSMMMIRPPRPAGTTTQYRPYSAGEYSLIKPIYARGGFDGIRKDILQWMVQG